MSIAIIQSRNCNVPDLMNRSPVAGVRQAEQLLRYWLRASDEVWMGMYDGEVACVWGLRTPTVVSDRPYLWLFTTKLVEKHKFVFVRHSQIVVEGILERYPVIIGHVSIWNHSARKWLKWLGAEFYPPEEFGAPFIIRRKNNG
jgi:hypothetical protein